MNEPNHRNRPSFNEAAFGGIFERPHLVQLLINPETGEIYDANPAACSFYGYSQAQLRELRIQDLNLQSESEVQDEMRHAKDEKRSFFHFRHRLANGQVRHVNVNSGPVRIGQRTLLHSVVFDTTDRVEAEQQRDRLALAMRSTADAIIVTDARGCIQTVNEAFTQVTGYTFEDVLGKPISMLKSGVQDPAFYEELWTTITSGSTWRGTLINRRKDGSTYDASSTISPLSGDAGYVAVQRDISDLVRAQHRADAAARARSIFLATMSHEIRTPLNGIIGLAHLLEGTELGREQHEYAHTIRSAGDALLAVVNDVLDFSKIGAGEFELEKSVFGLREIMTTVIEVLRPATAERDLAVQLHYDDRIPTQLLGDGARLQQVVMNLVSNAIKFTTKGNVDIHAQLLSESQSHVKLHIKVSDTGIGIPKEGQTRIFDPFRQIDASTTRRYGGTGLGLAISQRIVGALGGQIRVESDAGAGACFYFDLCFDRVKTIARVTIKAPARAESVDAARAELVVLVAEDNRVNRMVVMRLLERFGVQVQSASDGRQALELAQSQRFSLILMDVHMPYLDGLEVTQKIRAAENGLRTPIVALTAGATAEDRQACLDAGMDDYVSKPFRPADLERILQEYCGS